VVDTHGDATGGAPAAKTRSTRGRAKPIAAVEAPAGEAPAGDAPVSEAGDAAAPKKRAPARRKPVAAVAAEVPSGDKANE
jgi:hypothetical protein